MHGAIVAMVPESSLRNRGDLYRTATSDQSGRFVFHGIAPGTNKFFAWMNAEGNAPFRNAKLMKPLKNLRGRFNSPEAGMRRRPSNWLTKSRKTDALAL
jgi:hypothetical protein